MPSTSWRAGICLCIWATLTACNDDSASSGAAGAADASGGPRGPARDASLLPVGGGGGDVGDGGGGNAGGGGGDATGDAGLAGDAAQPDAAPMGGGAQPSDAALDPPDMAGETCFSQTYSPEAAIRPVDIIWVIDASPSMEAEIAIIEAELNDFAARVGASGLDYRVVLVGSDRAQYLPAEAHEFFEICVPPPLSAEPVCPDVDGPRYLHVREPVHSRESLSEAMATFERYQGFLRAEAVKHFVFVTDDDEGWGADAEAFTAFLAANPVFGADVTTHSVVDLVGREPGCAFDDSCSCGERIGAEYLALSEASGGITWSICEEDWAPLFDALVAEVVEARPVPCAFDMPDPGERYEVEYTEVVVRTVGPEGRDLPQVEGAGACGPEGGWYLDDPEAPARLLLCPVSCGLNAEALEIELACVYEKI